LTALATRRMFETSRSCHTAPLHIVRCGAASEWRSRASFRQHP